MLVQFYYILNCAIAIIEVVIVSLTKEIKDDEYPGLWYLVIAVMVSRFAIVLNGFFEALHADFATEKERENCFKLFKILSIIQALFSFVCFCTLMGITESENISTYYKNNYSSLYYTIVGETIVLYIVLLYFLCSWIYNKLKNLDK